MKEQVNLYLESDLVRQIDDIVEKQAPKYSSRSHFFEVIFNDWIKKVKQ